MTRTTQDIDRVMITKQEKAYRLKTKAIKEAIEAKHKKAAKRLGYKTVEDYLYATENDDD
jgi:hypothetical protein